MSWAKPYRPFVLGTFPICAVMALWLPVRFQSISESPMAHWLDGTLVEIKLESLSVMHPLLACYMYTAYMHIIACMLYLYLLYI